MLQVLIVEDEWLLADVLREDLEALGCRVLGPALGSSDGLDILASHRVDLAFVDTHLGGETCEDVLERCEQQGVAVVIFTGHLENDLPEFARGYKVLSKPYRPAALDTLLNSATRPTSPHAGTEGACNQ